MCAAGSVTYSMWVCAVHLRVQSQFKDVASATCWFKAGLLSYLAAASVI